MILTAYRKAASISGNCKLSFSSSIGSRLPLNVLAASRAGRVHSRRAQVGILAVAGVLSTSGYIYWRKLGQNQVDDARQDVERKFRRQETPLSVLLRSYIVYSMCSVPMLVDYSPSILTAFMSIPGVNYITEAFVRATFFTQFVGGDTALGTIPLLEQLRAENKGALFAYSVEVDEDEAAGKVKAHGTESSRAQPVHKHIVDEIIQCIDVAADFEDQRRSPGKSATISTGRRTWVAVKLTALLPDAQALVNFSKYLVDTRPPPARPVCFPGSPRPSDFDVLDVDPINLSETCPLTKEDLDALKELKEDLFRVCQRAKERGIKIIIDAEHSWYQPAIDAYQRALMAEFNRLPPRTLPSSLLSRTLGNKFRMSSTSFESGQGGFLVQPLIYGTFQAYLRRTPEHLSQSLLDAEAGNYALGVKLVRGAYHPFEVSAHEVRRIVNSHDKAISAASNLSSPSISSEALSPVWENKTETDACYNACARMLIKRVAAEINGDTNSTNRRNPDVGGSRVRRVADAPQIGVLFGTHNWESCSLILDALLSENLAVRVHEGDTEIIQIIDDTAERITLGQLYGMRDTLTNYLVDKTRSAEPFVIKYVPYGRLTEVMPYLGRRAIENKSLLGNGAAREERQQAGSEISKRLYSLFI